MYVFYLTIFSNISRMCDLCVTTLKRTDEKLKISCPYFRTPYPAISDVSKKQTNKQTTNWLTEINF